MRGEDEISRGRAGQEILEKKGIECRKVGEGNGVAGEDLEIERTIEERAWRRRSRAGEEKKLLS